MSSDDTTTGERSAPRRTKAMAVRSTTRRGSAASGRTTKAPARAKAPAGRPPKTAATRAKPATAKSKAPKTATRAKPATRAAKPAARSTPVRAAHAAPRKVDGRSTNGRKPGRAASADRASMRESAPETTRKPSRAKSAESHAEHPVEAMPAAPKKRGRPKNVVETPVEMPPVEDHEEAAEMNEADPS